MNIFTAELIGTALLLLLGNGVVASCVLKNTHASGSGWIVITAAWGFAVFTGVTVAGPVSGAHLNPAVTLGLAMIGKTPWELVPTYFAGEMLGGMLGAFLVWVYFRDQFNSTEDEAPKKAAFCTGPAIRNLPANFFCEVSGNLRASVRDFLHHGREHDTAGADGGYADRAGFDWCGAGGAAGVGGWV